MHEVIGWRAWYDGDAVYSSCCHSWASLPEDGLLVVMLYYADGRSRVLEGADYYFRAEHPHGEIFGSDMRPPDPSRYTGLSVKRGRWVPDDVMARVDQDAFDSRWP